MRLARWIVLLGQVTLAASGSARAQPLAADGSIRLELLECKQVSGASVHELVALEVAPRPLLAADGGGAAATRAEVSCVGGVAHIRVHDARLESPLSLELALRGMDRRARSRLLALAVAELIATSRLQRSSSANTVAAKPGAPGSSASNTSLRSAPAAAPRSAGSTGADERADDAARSARTAALSGEGGSVGEPDGDGAARVDGADVGVRNDVSSYDVSDGADGGEGVTRLGAQVWLGLGAARVAEPSMIAPAAAGGVSVYWRAFALTADVRFEHAQATRSVAELKLDAGSLALVPAWRVHGRNAELSLGPGVRVGYASLRANALEAGLVGQAVNGFWIAPCAQLALQLRFAQRWAVRLGTELAYITRTLRGLDPNGASLLQLSDLALAAQIGISWDALAAR